MSVLLRFAGFLQGPIGPSYHLFHWHSTPLLSTPNLWWAFAPSAPPRPLPARQNYPLGRPYRSCPWLVRLLLRLCLRSSSTRSHAESPPTSAGSKYRHCPVSVQSY